MRFKTTLRHLEAENETLWNIYERCNSTNPRLIGVSALVVAHVIGQAAGENETNQLYSDQSQANVFGCVSAEGHEFLEFATTAAINV